VLHVVRNDSKKLGCFKLLASENSFEQERAEETEREVGRGQSAVKLLAAMQNLTNEKGNAVMKTGGMFRSGSRPSLLSPLPPVQISCVETSKLLLSCSLDFFEL